MARALLVDDDPDNLLLLTMLLQRMGHQVLAAASADQALHALDQLAEDRLPDVAVVDIVMAPVTGLQLLQHLRRDHRPVLARIPAILLTARELDSDPYEAQALQATLMKKPPARGRLAAAIEQALQPTASV